MAFPIRGTAWDGIPGQMTTIADGSPFVGTVTCYIKIDGGAFTLGTTASGVCTSDGNGSYSYAPTAAETDGGLITFQYLGTGAGTVEKSIGTLTLSQQSATARSTATSLTVTVLDAITRALMDLKIYQAGETPSNDDAELGRVTLNDWIDSLATQGLSMYTVTRSTWTITTASSYTIGVGATINVPRPVNPQAIVDIGFQDTSQSPTLELLVDGGVLSQDQYDAIPNKTLTGTYPQAWFYNPTFGSTGYGTLTPWPVPTSATLQGVIYLPTQVSEFNAVTDTISLPPGYRRFFRTNLALELASAFDVEPSQLLVKAAMESKADIKRANMRILDLGCGDAVTLFGGRRRFNFYTGTS